MIARSRRRRSTGTWNAAGAWTVPGHGRRDRRDRGPAGIVYAGRRHAAVCAREPDRDHGALRRPTGPSASTSSSATAPTRIGTARSGWRASIRRCSTSSRSTAPRGALLWGYREVAGLAHVAHLQDAARVDPDRHVRPGRCAGNVSRPRRIGSSCSRAPRGATRFTAGSESHRPRRDRAPGDAWDRRCNRGAPWASRSSDRARRPSRFPTATRSPSRRGSRTASAATATRASTTTDDDGKLRRHSGPNQVVDGDGVPRRLVPGR